MSLPDLKLDDRKFQDIVDDAKRAIGLRCPEWTDHNVSDPGVTLIELFAMMTEMMLFRLNQVPEKNYRKFLELIGVQLEPPAAARTDLKLRLTLPIADLPGEEKLELTIPARESLAATLRTEFEESIVFSSDADLRFVRPRLAHILAVPAPAEGGEDLFADAREFDTTAYAKNAAYTFQTFSREPVVGDCLYFGFANDVSANVIELEMECVENAGPGRNEDYPAHVWEYWNGEESRWDQLIFDVVDGTFGFKYKKDGVRNDIPKGYIQIPMPYNLTARQVDSKRGYWIRCRYELNLPPKSPSGLLPSKYIESPEIRAVLARTIGAMTPASNSVTIADEVLGESDGMPAQIFRLRHSPILALRPGETIYTGLQGAPPGEWDEWTPVFDFADSRDSDRHFVCDTLTGEISFGPVVPEPSGGRPGQYGAIPAKGVTIAMRRYRTGGGSAGNVSPGKLRVLKSALPYIADVSNPRRAEGGREQETLERAKMRGRTILRVRERAVTSEDFEELARRGSTGVGRACCLQANRLHDPGENGQRIPPGLVRVLIVPAMPESLTLPGPLDLLVSERTRREVEEYLDERRLLTTVLQVSSPEYIFVSTDITLVAAPKMERETVRRSVQQRLDRFLHPLFGGPDGTGWPFKQPLKLADIYSQVQLAEGVAFLRDVKLFRSEISDPMVGTLRDEERVPLQDGINVMDGQLLCTREHRIRVQSIYEVD